MAATNAQITALEEAIASGTTSVEYGDKKVVYRSLAEMRQILAELKLEFAGLPRIRQVRVVTRADKGL
jgi:DNA-directed RNA polymerase subunit H (RpoH/RPB5)